MIKDNVVIGCIHLFALDELDSILLAVNCCIQRIKIKYSLENACKH
jgi:hypothetical protein